LREWFRDLTLVVTIRGGAAAAAAAVVAEKRQKQFLALPEGERTESCSDTLCQMLQVSLADTYKGPEARPSTSVQLCSHGSRSRLSGLVVWNRDHELQIS
jgi:hypothetical protein